MNIPLAITLAVVSIPFYGMLASLIFGNSQGFFDSLCYLWTDNLVSAVRDEYWDDQWAEFKFGVWIIGSGLVILSEYLLIKDHLPALFFWFDQWGYLFAKA